MSIPECVEKLTNERIYTALLAGAFINDPEHPLKNDHRLWKIVLPYFNSGSPAARPGLLAQLTSELDSEEIVFFGEQLLRDLDSVYTLQGKLEHVFEEVMRNDSIKPSSFLGAVAKDVWYYFAVLDIDDATKIWHRLLTDSEPFTTHLGLHKISSIDSLQRILSKALVPPTRFNKNTENSVCSREAPDISRLHYEIHRECDLNRSVDTGLVGLAQAFASQSNATAALEVINESFVRDRRSLIKDMRQEGASSQLKENSARDNCERVSWLHNLLCVFDRPPQESIPAALDVPLNQLKQYYNANISTEPGKLEAYLQNLQSEVILGQISVDTLSSLKDAKSYFHLLFQPSEAQLVLPFFVVSAQIWHAFGYQSLCMSYRNLALHSSGGYNGVTVPVLSDLALSEATDLWLPLTSLKHLCRIGNENWCDVTQTTFTLVMAFALTLAQNTEAAKFVLDQIDEFSLKRRHKEAYVFVSVYIKLAENDCYSAYLLAQKRAEYHESCGAQYLHLVYQTLAVRCLVLSERAAHAAHAEILMKATLETALDQKRLGIVAELSVLEARRLFNCGKIESCYAICGGISSLIATAATIKLQCEWSVLYYASASLLKRDAPAVVDIDQCAECLYFESNERLANLIPNPSLGGGGTGKHTPVVQAIQAVFVPTLPTYLSNDTVSLVYKAYKEHVRPPEKPFVSVTSPRGNASVLTDDDSLLESNSQKRSWSLNGSPQRRNSKRRSVNRGKPRYMPR